MARFLGTGPFLLRRWLALHPVSGEVPARGNAQDPVDGETQQPQGDDSDEGPVDAPVVSCLPDQCAQTVLGGNDLGGDYGEEAVSHSQAGTGDDLVAMGTNLFDASQRGTVFETAMRTTTSLLASEDPHRGRRADDVGVA